MKDFYNAEELKEHLSQCEFSNSFDSGNAKEEL